MPQVYDVIVIGVGAMGASACDALTRRGVSVLGLEQFSLAHDRGSSHGQSRMIRLAYYEHPNYVPLLRRAYELWGELEAATGRKLLHVTGGVYAGPPGGEVVAGSIASARQHGLPHESLTAAALRDRSPQFRLPDDWPVVLEPAAGFLLPEACVAAFAERAIASGADLRFGSRVHGWRAAAGEPLCVQTDAGEFVGRRLVVCGGAWSGRLLHELRMKLRVSRQVMGWVRPPRPEPFALGQFPVWAVENLDGTLQYGFPVLPGEQTLKVAWHGAGMTADPETVDRQINAADVATFLTSLPHLLPSAAGPVADARVCLYTNSADHHFILDRHPADERITFACGFSGHGFKFASVVGEVLAELALDGRSHLPVEFLRLR